MIEASPSNRTSPRPPAAKREDGAAAHEHCQPGEARHGRAQFRDPPANAQTAGTVRHEAARSCASPPPDPAPPPAAAGQPRLPARNAATCAAQQSTRPQPHLPPTTAPPPARFQPTVHSARHPPPGRPDDAAATRGSATPPQATEQAEGQAATVTPNTLDDGAAPIFAHNDNEIPNKSAAHTNHSPADPATTPPSPTSTTRQRSTATSPLSSHPHQTATPNTRPC